MNDENKYEIEISGQIMTLTKIEFDQLLLSNGWKVDADGNIYEEQHVGVVPKILDQWFAERVEYRKLEKQYSDSGDKEKEGFYKRRQLRQKIFLNSVYGVLGLPIFRFYDRDNAEATTISGQTIIRTAEKLVNDTYVTKFKEKNVVPPTDDFVKYIDTDSLYVSAMPLASLEGDIDKMLSETVEFHGAKMSKMEQFTIQTVTDIAAKINKLYVYMVPRVFNVSAEKNRIKIVPDVIAKKALWIAKKRYAMLKVYDMEKMKPVTDKKGNDGKLEVKGIDTVKSSFPAVFRKFMGEMLDLLLRSTPREVLDEKIMQFEEEIDNHSIFDLAKTTSAKFVSQNGENNYNPKGRKLFQFVLKTPIGVKAALAYNDFLKIWGLENVVEPVQHGSKIKWVYLLPNDFCVEQLAMKADDTDPDKILEFITTHIDRRKMYNSELHSKLEEIYHCVGWKYPNRGSQLASKVFDFSEAW